MGRVQPDDLLGAAGPSVEGLDVLARDPLVQPAVHHQEPRGGDLLCVVDGIQGTEHERAQEAQQLADKSEPLRNALDANRAEQARQMAERARDLAQAQRDVSEATRQTLSHTEVVTSLLSMTLSAPNRPLAVSV